MVFTGANLEEDLFLQDTTVGGTLFCTATTDLKPNLPCRIAKDAWLLGAVVTGGIDISGAHIGGNLIMQNTGVGQNLHAKVMGGHPTQIKGLAVLKGVRVSGAAEFLGFLLQGELDLDGASIGGDLVVAFDLNEADDWRIVRSRIGGRLHADGATISKRVILMGLTVHSTDSENVASPGVRKDAASAEKHGVDFVGAQINGEFLLYSKGLVEENLQSKKAGFQAREISEKREKELLVQASRERVEIQGDLRLTRAQVLGGIVLDGSTIVGELDLQDANVRANVTCRPVQLAALGEPIRACVRRAYFETLEAVGNIDLTGLRIGGDLILRDARIRGRLELCHFGRGRNPTDNQRRAAKPKVEQNENGKQKSADQFTEIGGVLRLDAAEITHVILSGDSFGEREAPAPARSSWERIKDNVKASIRTFKGHMRAGWDRGDYLLIMFFLRGGHLEEATSPGEHPDEEEKDTVVLKRANIGRLEILKPLPGILDLSDLKVGSWEERASFFKDMLQHSYPFRRSSYVAIDNDLRNKGRGEEADEVHVWMRRRDRIYTKGVLKVLWDRLLDLSTKYGTTSARLVWVMVILFVYSVWVFSNPNHVEYKIAPLAAHPPPVEHPAAADWKTSDAVFLAMQLHVPIVSLGIHGDMEPSGTKIKAYAMVVTAASWVMWPLFIASISGFLRKRS